MAVKYFQGNNDDLAPLKSIGVDDDSACNWWGGVQKCFASIAVASALATSTLSGQVAQQISQDRDEIPAGFLTSQAYTSSGPQTFRVKIGGCGYSVRYAPDTDDFPTSVVTTPVDEDFWINPVPPVAATNRSIPTFWTDSCDIFAAVANQPDEDFWQSGVLPIAQQYFRFPYLAEPDSIPAGSLYGQPDEDFWLNPVFPVQASNRVLLPLGDPEEIPAATLYGQPDEDFWRNAVAPVPASNLWPQQWAFDVQESAGSLFGQYDEDFWISGIAPKVWTNLYPQQASFDVQEPAGSLSGQPDEDFWVSGVAPVPPSMRFALPLGDQDDVYPTVPATIGTDEDFWQNPTPPVQATAYRSPLFRDQDEIPAGSLYGQADEDFWTNPVAPVQASLFRSPLFRDADEIPAGNLYGQPPEDYWQNAVRPVPWTLYQPLPYLFDAAEFATGFIPTEDFWQNPAVPVTTSNRFPQQSAFDEQEPSGSLFGEFDEDFWQSGVAAVPPSIYRSPLFVDLEEIPAGSLLKSPSVEEPYWQNGPKPVAASQYQKFPYGYEAGDVAVSAQNGTALPSGLSLVIAESDPTASVPAAGRTGKRGRRGFPSERPSIHAIARAQSLSLSAEYAKPSAAGEARAQVAMLDGLRIDYCNPAAKGIRNPTDEELIAILMGI